ncbi:transporter substrate-binding domain-containing protein [Mesorhizobium caraganae]|uniref:transporter substrate-binding domain-containing protein n=1 Tax=Mesorhizobium caraganae TaxID=483206 RepID=UPI0017833927|nr:transporter substrate-binding domain-containing protein [Mesorhizobium caraganae]
MITEKALRIRPLIVALFAVVTIWSGTSVTAKADGLVNQIKQRGEIIVGTEADFEPFAFRVDGKILGYDKDILDLVAEKLGVKVTLVDLPFQGLLPGLLSKKFDLKGSSTTITPERAAKFAFTRPTGTGVTMILARLKDDSIKEPKDLNGKVVATQLASSPQPKAERFGERLKAEGGAGFELKLFSSFPECNVALASGQVDAIAVPSTTAALLMKKLPDTFKIIGTIENPVYLAWVVRPEDGDLRDFINAQIGELADSGKLKELQMKWFGYEMELPAHGYLPEGAK